MESNTQEMFAHSNHSMPKPIIRIKTERQKLNEDNRDQNSNFNDDRIWREYQDLNQIQETANIVSSKISDRLDYISENCIKVEKNGNDYLVETNSTYYNQEHRNHPVIEKALNFTEYCVSRADNIEKNSEWQQNGSSWIKLNSELLNLGCDSDIPDMLNIKTEPDDLKREININFEDHEKHVNVCLNQVDSETFDLQENCVFIKEDIDLEEHCIKSEPERPKGKIKSATNFRHPRFECHLCDYKTRIKNNLKLHSRWHADPNTQLWFYCTKCSFKTKQKGHLKRHDVTHQRPGEFEMFICGICNYKFKQKCSLRRHIYNIHVVPQTEIKLSDAQIQSGHAELFTCGICDYKFKEKCLLRRHIYNIHVPQTEAKPGDVPIQLFQCDQCTYATFKKGLLLSHLDKHKDTGDPTNLYICDACSFSTKYRRNLRVHLETHKDSHQIFECDICEFKTRILYCLKRHFLTKKHLKTVGKLEQYSPRSRKLKGQ